MCVSLRIGQIVNGASCGTPAGSAPFLIDAPKYMRDVFGYQCSRFLYPCGRCAECVKRRRNEIAYKIENQLRNSKDSYFLTFTYSDEYLPISRRKITFDTDTGEVLDYHRCEVLKPSNGVNIVRSRITNKSASRLCRYLFLDDSKNGIRYCFTPSLDRSMICRMFDAFRQKYRRLYKNERGFSYWCIGEYGPRTCRPHFHCVTTGLTAEDIKMLLEYWPYGYVDVKRVECLKHCKNGIVHLGRYLGKYVSKGVSECPSVRDGFAEKPRIVSSPNFGTMITEKMRNYFLCFDMVGRYNPHTLQRSDGSYLTKLEVDMISKELSKRLCYEIDGYTFMLPRSVINRLSSNYSYLRPFDNKLQTVSGKSPLSRLPLFSYASTLAVDRYLEVCNRKYLSAAKNYFERTGNVLFTLKEVDSEKNIQASLQNLRRDDFVTYSKSFC